MMNTEYSAGQRITAIVDRCEVYGVYLSSPGLKILVLIPDTSWVPVRDLTELYQAGDRVDVVLLRKNEKNGYWVGSINATHPDDDPLAHLARLPRDMMFVATVKHKFEGRPITVQLENHLFGELPASDQTHDLRPGDKVNVCVEGIDIQNRWVRIRLA